MPLFEFLVILVVSNYIYNRVILIQLLTTKEEDMFLLFVRSLPNNYALLARLYPLNSLNCPLIIPNFHNTMCFKLVCANNWRPLWAKLFIFYPFLTFTMHFVYKFIKVIIIKVPFLIYFSTFFLLLNLSTTI